MGQILIYSILQYWGFSGQAIDNCLKNVSWDFVPSRYFSVEKTLFLIDIIFSASGGLIYLENAG